MVWYETFDSVFWVTMATLFTGSIGLAFKYCIRSKCENFNCCWGGLVIVRNVDIEAQEEIKEMEMGIRRGQSTPQINTN